MLPVLFVDSWRVIAYPRDVSQCSMLFGSRGRGGDEEPRADGGFLVGLVFPE
jgi:hypothetical protein